MADSAGGALGAILSKMKRRPDFGLTTFTKLFDGFLILFHAAGVQGFEEATEYKNIHCRGLRCFLGVHKYTTISWQLKVTQVGKAA